MMGEYGIYDRAPKPIYRPLAEYEAAEAKLFGNVIVDRIAQEDARKRACMEYDARIAQIRAAKKRRNSK